MKKFFSFAGTISGTTFFLRTLFTIVLSIPLIITLISKWTSYFTSLGNFDISDMSLENQMAIQAFGDELAHEPGDLAFFHNKGDVIVHVGIILMDNHIIHASGKVRIDRLDQTGIYNNEKNTHTHYLRYIKKII